MKQRECEWISTKGSVQPIPPGLSPLHPASSHTNLKAMAKLVKLATEGDVQRAWENWVVCEYLQQLALGDYAKYRVVSAGKKTRDLPLAEDDGDF